MAMRMLGGAYAPNPPSAHPLHAHHPHPGPGYLFEKQPPEFPIPHLAPGTWASLLLKYKGSSYLKTFALAVHSAWNIFSQVCPWLPPSSPQVFAGNSAFQREAFADQPSKMPAPNTPRPSSLPFL